MYSQKNPLFCILTNGALVLMRVGQKFCYNSRIKSSFFGPLAGETTTTGGAGGGLCPAGGRRSGPGPGEEEGHDDDDQGEREGEREEEQEERERGGGGGGPERGELVAPGKAGLTLGSLSIRLTDDQRTDLRDALLQDGPAVLSVRTQSEVPAVRSVAPPPVVLALRSVLTGHLGALPPPRADSLQRPRLLKPAVCVLDVGVRITFPLRV